MAERVDQAGEDGGWGAVAVVIREGLRDTGGVQKWVETSG